MDSEGPELTNHSGDLGLSIPNTTGDLEQDVIDEELNDDAVQKARDHIALIRKSKGLDNLEGEESSQNIEDLEKALDVLSDQLYSQPTHFLLEFIQNADDNSYKDVQPTISFTTEIGHLRIDCNEVGFAPANVEAICRIARSTKQDRSQGYIGEKGIGFKSVFKIADVVWISSQPYTFKFDRTARLGMIAPVWEDLQNFPGETQSGITQFYLQLSREKDAQGEEDLSKQLRFFDSTLLLFLRKLKKIDIVVNDHDWTKRFISHITRWDTQAYGGEMITIKKNWTKTKKADETLRYLVVRHSTTDMPIEPKRKGIQASEAVLAFPFIGNNPAFHLQKAYAFLPIRDSGFRFLLQADFILIANREDIEKSNQWNDRLLTGLADCFIEAVARFNSAEASVLRHTWLGFLQDLPQPGANNFSSLVPQIFDRLRCRPVLESQEGGFVPPAGAFFVPRAFRDVDDRFILNCAGNCQRYISASYETYDTQYTVLKKMGVEILNFTHFLNILKAYMAEHTEDFRNQSDGWHSLVAKILYDQASDTELQSLAVIPLQNGHWISKVEGQAHFHSQEVITAGKVPEGVPELLIVEHRVSEHPDRRRLLEKLGVKTLNQAEVCRLVIKTHESTKPPDLTLDVYISHAAYLFEATLIGVFSPKDHDFWVADKDGCPRLSTKMYLDKADSAHPLGSLLNEPWWTSCILHSAYLLAYKGKKQEKWIKWLETHLAIRSTIRIAVRGQLTAEFEHLKATHPSPMVLEIMMESWTKDPSQMTPNIKQQLGAMDVLYENGDKKTVHLNKTCLPLTSLKTLAPPGIFFVQLASDLPVWKKLRELGVVVEPNLAFYLQCLSLIQGKQVTKAHMTGLYKSIDSHWREDPKLVEAHFSKFDNFAVYVPVRREWVHRRACVWESAPGVNGGIILADQYPELQSFFFHRLKIPSATITKAIDELRSNAAHNSLDMQRRKALIFALSDFLRKSPKDWVKLQALKDVPVMPIADSKYGTSAINLASLNKESWYFADHHRYYTCFQSKLAFADFRIEECARLAPLDNAMQQAWSCGPHRLSVSVILERDFGSHPAIDANATNLLRQKVKYIRRIARATHTKHSRDLELKLHRLNDLTLYASPGMVVKTSVVKGQVGNTTVYGELLPGKVMIRETKKDVRIYVHPRSMKDGRIPPTDTSEELCSYCGISDEKMKRLVFEILLEDDHRDIEDLLTGRGVGGYDENDLEAIPLVVAAQNRASSCGQAERPPTNVEAPSKAQSIITMPSKRASAIESISSVEPTALNEIVNSSKPSKVQIQGFSSSASTSSVQAREYQQLARHAEIGASIRIGGRENVTSQTQGSTESAHRSKKAKSSKILTPSIRPGRDVLSHQLSHERPVVMLAGRDQIREENIGVGGEEAVFNTLKDILGQTIDEAMWTSELRHRALGCGPWSPDDPTTLYSDFTVRDRDGKLGNWMLSSEVDFPTEWQSQDLLYHIEVKSTAKSFDDPFFMSHLQMDKAKALSETSSVNPKEVFVIFRVYDFESTQPGLQVYCDPWAMIKSGKLSRSTQERRVIPA